MPIIAPSLLSADFLHLAQDIRMVNDSKAEWLHLDVMDGRFVPNISYGFSIIRAVRAASPLFLDAHLMIVEPEKYVADFIEAGCDQITVHLEASTHLHRTIQMIKDGGAKAGVALNPHTPVTLLQDIAHELDLILIMSVNPGFGGQKFIPQSLQKIKQAKDLIERTGSKALIEVDGGVGPNNALELCRAGADVLVAGNAIFNAPNPVEVIAKMADSRLP